MPKTVFCCVHRNNTRFFNQVALIVAALGWGLVAAPPLKSQQTTPAIWSPVADPTGSRAGACYFRKKFTLVKPERAELILDSVDQPEIYLNGRLVDWTKGPVREDGIAKLDVSPLMQPGVNLVAVRIPAQRNRPAGLALRLRVKETGEVKWRSLTTDDSWLTRTEAMSMWQFPSFDDVTWLRAQRSGSMDLNWTKSEASDNQVRGTVKGGLPVSAADLDSVPPITTPARLASGAAVLDKSQLVSSGASTSGGASLSLADGEPVAPPPASQPANRRGLIPNPAKTVPPATAQNQPAPPQPDSADSPAAAGSDSAYSLAPGFNLQQLMSDEEVGSVIAMAFDEFGQLLFSKEGEGLQIADLSIPYGRTRTAVLCDQVTNCQGILPLNGKVYVTGQGPDGLALYELVKGREQAQLKVSRTLIRFTGQVGEHGPHGLTLGPDGMLYVVVGNHSGVAQTPSTHSPYRNGYDADLVPRYEDPGGHALGIKAPGGTIVRLSLDGKTIETYAGGLRNIYDLAFNSQGDLFAHESDMESDLGLAWYRPTCLFHVTAGADLGWRSGWSQMPSSYPDTIPPIAQFGRGSPAGIVSYQHWQFPEKYHDCLFLADWSEGRILATRLNPDGSSYATTSETFLSGKPLNVTDLEVGEDGGLYFCTGGRGTRGGIFRITWAGKSPAENLTFRNDLDKVLRHPQPNSAWARQNLALLRQSLGNQWNGELVKVATDTHQPATLRCRALDMHYLYSGPVATESLEVLLNDSNPQVRAKATWLAGLTPGASNILVQVLGDAAPQVQRAACEALLRQTEKPAADRLIPLLGHRDRLVRLASRRLLEQTDNDDWCAAVIKHADLQVFLNGSIAVLNAQPSLSHAYEILARASTTMQGFVPDTEFLALLRVIQLALVRGQVEPEKIPAFNDQLYQEFPTKSPELNREIIRILAFLNTGDPEEKYPAYFESASDDVATKILVAMYLASKSGQLQDATRLAVIDYLERTAAATTAGTYRLYLVRCIRETAETLTPASHGEVLKRGGNWPHALVPVFYKLPSQPDPDLVQTLIELDRELAVNPSEAAKHARLGMIALLAQAQTETAWEHLRSLWRSEESRRSDLAIGLAQNPDGKNWNYLVASLPILDDLSCQQVLQKLQTVSLRPVEAKYYRQVIEIGYRLQEQGAVLAAQLLQHWSAEEEAGTAATTEASDWKAKLDGWKSWYQRKWPEEAPINTAAPPVPGGLSFDQILERLNGSQPGDAERGMLVFEQANCAKCHRVGVNGLSAGPDLTGIAKRFSRRETLESILKPDAVVSDRYRSTLVLTTAGEQLLGMKVDETPDAISLLLSDGRVAKVQKTEIEESRLVNRSAMPANSLQGLNADQIADLFAYLFNSPAATASQDPIDAQRK